MRPSPRSKLPTPLYVCVVVMLTLVNVWPSFFNTSHDDLLQLTVQSPDFSYKVSTYRNSFGNRCALIRCGSEYAKRLYHESSCDILFTEIIHSKQNRSSRLCLIDYIDTQWETLSRTYNHGFTYISDRVKLGVVPDDLPLDSKAVHFAHSRNNLDISIDWLSVWPSNKTRAVIRDWHRASIEKGVKGAELEAINHVRNCRAPDVVCHSRASTISWHCDAVRDQQSCMASSRYFQAAKIGMAALAIVILLHMLLATIVHVVPRLRGMLGGSRNAHDMYIKFTPALCIALVITLAGEHWIEIIRTLARIVGVTYRHDLRADVFSAPVEVYRAVPDLQGLYNGYAYVFRDSNDMVRISGPGISIVVGLTSVVLFIKRLLYNGFLVRCLFAMLVVRVACDAVLVVAGRNKSNHDDDEDEYVRLRSEIPTLLNPSRERNRSFVSDRKNTRV